VDEMVTFTSTPRVASTTGYLFPMPNTLHTPTPDPFDQSQVAVTDELRGQMRALAHILIDVFLEQRKVTRVQEEAA
jgi:hypothetical protein